MIEVYKHDGTTQCGKGVETTLEEMQMDLERLGGKVLKAEKRMWPIPIPRQCDLPTGWCNMYQLGEDTWPRQAKEILSAGFGLWAEGVVTIDGPGLDRKENAKPEDSHQARPFQVRGQEPGETLVAPWPLAIMGLAHCDPKGMGALLGKQLRVYHDGDSITQDCSVDRVNIVLNRETAAIVDVWFG